MTVETDRLRLAPFAPEHLLALIEGPDAFAERFGLPVALGLHRFYAEGAVNGEISPGWVATLRTARAADVWVHGFAVVHRDDGKVIGTIGYKGAPDADGMVEIGYGIDPDYQGRGYATEAAAAVVAFASADPRVRLVRAHTRPAANPSTRVLEKCGFRKVDEVIDPEDGLVWRWERGPDRTPAGPPA